MIAEACAHLQPSIILSLWYQALERAGEPDEIVPKLHLFSGRGLLKNMNLSMEEGNMGNYRHSGDSDGSVMRKTGGRTTSKDRRSEENSEDWQKAWVKGFVSLRSG